MANQRPTVAEDFVSASPIQEALGLLRNTQVATSREVGHLVTERMEHYCGRMSSVPNVVRLSM
jgi:hypothetical protein